MPAGERPGAASLGQGRTGECLGLSEKLQPGQKWPGREVWGILHPPDNLLEWEESRSIAVPSPSSLGLPDVSMGLEAALGSECFCAGRREKGWDKTWDGAGVRVKHCTAL